MGFWCGLGDSPAGRFPNRLLDDTPIAVPRRRVLLAVLVLLCVIPRAWAAWNWNVLWADSVTYLHASEVLARGDYQAAFADFGLNSYSVILCVLRQTGLPWTVAGEWWSVAMASLAVLPLFGWVRRQFDDQLAFTASVLYAFHPKLVASSPLIIRDPTFWFLFCLSIYLSWRAVGEIRWWLFAAAGIVLALAVHTRTEGWLLLVPLALWSVWRLPAVASRRVRLVTGTVLSMAMIPLGVAVVNFTLLRDCPQWQIIRGDHVELALGWLGLSREPSDGEPGAAKPPPAERGTSSGPPSARSRESLSGLTLARKLVVRLVKSFSYVYGLLTLVGLWLLGRGVLRRDNLALLAAIVLLLIAIWIRYSQVEMDIRYFLPVVLISLPTTAMGLLALSELLLRVVAARLGWTAERRIAVLLGCLAVVALLGTFDRKLSARGFMYQQASLGTWIRDHLGPRQQVAGSIKDLRLIEYYADSSIVSYADEREYVGEPLLLVLEDRRPDVVLLWRDWHSTDGWAAYAEIFQRQSQLGYRRVPQDRLPPECSDIRVLVRDDKPL